MKTPQTYTCPVCDKGRLTPQTRDYAVNLPDGGHLIVKNVPMDVCDFCGEIALGEEAADQIDVAISEYSECPSPNELVCIRKSFQVTQNQISEILGLGIKTWNRWENGVQYPSRSMGYYLRVLRQFPQAFDWLQKRSWRAAKRLNPDSIDFKDVFPSLASRGYEHDNNQRPRESQNAARALFGIH